MKAFVAGQATLAMVVGVRISAHCGRVTDCEALEGYRRGLAGAGGGVLNTES